MFIFSIFKYLLQLIFNANYKHAYSNKRLLFIYSFIYLLSFVDSNHEMSWLGRLHKQQTNSYSYSTSKQQQRRLDLQLVISFSESEWLVHAALYSMLKNEVREHIFFNQNWQILKRTN